MVAMPPSNQTPFDPTDHLLPAGHKSSAGPIVGTIIILVLLIIGALYFWGASLNREDPSSNLPFIPPETSTTTAE